MWHNFYGITSVSKTDIHYTTHCSPTTAPFFTQRVSLTILEFKHFQGPLTLNYITFKHQIHFQGLSRTLKNEIFSRTFKEEWPPHTKYESHFISPNSEACLVPHLRAFYQVRHYHYHYRRDFFIWLNFAMCNLTLADTSSAVLFNP